MRDVIIIGAGPAGISAALYARRAGLDALVLNAGGSQLEQAHKIDNYYGFPGGISGAELFRNGIEQARALGVEVIDAEATGVQPSAGGYSLTAGGASHEAKSLVIATGNRRIRPRIEGLKEFEGRGVSYCAVCDGFFYRKKRVAVIGAGEYALAEAAELSHVAGSVVVLTDGGPTGPAESAGFRADGRKIARIRGSEKVGSVEFEDGGAVEADGVFVALGSAGAADFARKLGLMTDGDAISTDSRMATNAPGVFACGNAAGGLLQICKAVHEGAVAGLSAAEFVRGLKT